MFRRAQLLFSAIWRFLKPHLPILAALLVVQLILFWRRFFGEGVLVQADFYYLTPDSLRQYYHSTMPWAHGAMSAPFGGPSLWMPMSFVGFLISGLAHLFHFSHSAFYFLFFGFPLAFFSVFFSYFCAYRYYPRRLFALVFSIVYLFNSYFFILQTGHLFLAVSYSMIPLILLIMYYWIRSPKMITSASLLLLFFLFISYDVRLFYLLFIILLIYVSSYIVLHWKSVVKLYKRYLVHVGFLVVGILLLSSYFLLPMLFSSAGSLASGVYSVLFADYVTLPDGVFLHHPFFTPTGFALFQVTPVPSYMYFLAIPLLYPLYRMRPTGRWLILFSAGVYLLGVLLVKQSSPPFPMLYQWLFNYIPGFSFFRESSKFFIFVSLGLASILGISSVWFFDHMKSVKTSFFSRFSWSRYLPYGFGVLIVGLFAIQAVQFLIYQRHYPLMDQQPVDPNIPPLEASIKASAKDDLSLRFSPILWSPGEHRFMPRLAQNPSMVAGGFFSALQKESSLPDKYLDRGLFLTTPEGEELLTNAGVHYVALYGSQTSPHLAWGGSMYPKGSDMRDYRHVIGTGSSYLETVGWLSTPSFHLFEYTGDRPNCRFCVYDGGKSYSEAALRDVVMDGPSRYRLTVNLSELSEKEFTLYFAEAYDEGWKAYVRTPEDLKQRPSKSSWLEYISHRSAAVSSNMARTHFQEWNLDPSKLSTSAAQSDTIEIVLYHDSFYYFWIGILVTTIILSGLSLFLLIYIINWLVSYYRSLQ